ncbi:hypothetical protein RB195_025093 [Necator americanus]|uniref:long-chain-fatty-acid--CoA ligase n=1 Tax=Necator americanus TaxID=51031 RepID=A0ABR1EQW9_NECAM
MEDRKRLGVQPRPCELYMEIEQDLLGLVLGRYTPEKMQIAALGCDTRNRLSQTAGPLANCATPAPGEIKLVGETYEYYGTKVRGVHRIEMPTSFHRPLFSRTLSENGFSATAVVHSGMGDNDINEDLDGKERPFYVLALISILKVIFLIYDVIVFVPFKIFADPSEKLTMSQRLKARPIGNDDPRSAWRHVSTINGELAISTFDCCRTIADQWNEAVRKFQRSDCFGTREVLSISKEKKTSGKIFEKWEMGEYHWKSFEEVDKRTNLVASGLSSLGLDKNDKVVLFAETREEWMTTAIGCFKSCFPVVTVYATLGEEAVEFAVKEVSAKVVITSENLLPKVEEAIKHGLDIYTVIYFESPDPNSAVYYTSEEAHVLSFSQLLNMGKRK